MIKGFCFSYFLYYFFFFWNKFYSHIYMNLGTNMLWEGQGVVEAVFSTLRSLIAMTQIQHQKKVWPLGRPFLRNLPAHQAPNTCLQTPPEIWIPSVSSKWRKDTWFTICLKRTLTPMATATGMVYHQHTIHQTAVREPTALVNLGKTCSWTRPLIGLFPSNENLVVRWYALIMIEYFKPLASFCLWGSLQDILMQVKSRRCGIHFEEEDSLWLHGDFPGNSFLALVTWRFQVIEGRDGDNMVGPCRLSILFDSPLLV